MPVVFVYDHPHLYIPVDRKPKQVEDWRDLRRVRNVVTNGRVSVVVDVYDEDWSKLRWVLLEGTAEVVESGDERDRAVAALEAKYPQYRTLSLEGCPVIRVDVERRVEWRSSEEGSP